ncbi:MAG: efflux RND transporter periplasmic adaptor subunit [Syntrophales bacterium]|nr:efflux RND transporter periplasmic adaptor subunit [Syntrophales bacterium]
MASRIRSIVLLIAAFFCLFSSSSFARSGDNPANVVVAKITRGTIIPEKTFIGSVYYPEVSDIAAEVSGRVEEVAYEEGQAVVKDSVLVRMDSSLLKKTFLSKTASFEEILSDLARAKKDLERTKNLYERKILAEKDLDDQIFTVKGLEKKAASLKAEAEHLEIELGKTVIRAPFSGVIIKKNTAVGEWLSPGSAVATIAMNNSFDVMISVPEDIIFHLQRGMKIPVTAGRIETEGTITAIIPQGDVATRTFPVKIRIEKAPSLMEGMEAKVTLPAGQSIDSFFVPRDAILNVYNETFIVAVDNSRASLIKVDVVGYENMYAGIKGNRIKESLKVVVKGNERLRDGDPVNVLEETE